MGGLNKAELFMLLKSRAYYKGVDDEAKGGGAGGKAGALICYPSYY